MCSSDLLNGTAQINSGGSFGAAPTYGSASTLVYNSGTTYGRSSEWASGATSEPANVQLSNNTTLNYPNGAGSFTHTITGNLTIDAGSALYMDYGSPGTGVGLLTVGGNVVLNGSLSLGNQVGGDLKLSGNFTRGSGGVLTNNSRAIEFSGSVAKTITGATTFDYLTITNSGGITLANDITVNNTLTLNNNKITTGANKVAMGSSASVSRGTGYVVGNLQYTVPTGSGVSRTFDIGDASNYTPASVTFGNVSTSGTLLGSINNAPGAPAAGSGLSSTKYVNRQWTLTNTGTAFDNYSTTLNFVAGDIQGAGNTANFAVAKNTSGT